MLPYNRALHLDDYTTPELSRHVGDVRAFERLIGSKGVRYRKDHAHREWEYANVLRQLRELLTADHAGEVDFKVPREIKILDTGFGMSYFTPMLKHEGYNVEASDSMAYGDCTPQLVAQCHAFGFEIPLHKLPVQDMSPIADQTFDVTLCISVIEHLASDAWAKGWSELARVTKRGGYVMVTTDYFGDEDAWNASPFRSIQHQPVTPEFIGEYLGNQRKLRWVGGVDLGYRGAFVNNYSFLNLCLKRL